MAHGPSRGDMTVTQRQQGQKKEAGEEDMEYSPTEHLQRKNSINKNTCRYQQFSYNSEMSFLWSQNWL